MTHTPIRWGALLAVAWVGFAGCGATATLEVVRGDGSLQCEGPGVPIEAREG